MDYILSSSPLAYNYLLIVSGIHFFGFMLVSTGYSEYYSKGFHVIGMFTAMTNSIFVLSCIPHMICFILGVLVLRKVRRKIALMEKKEEQEELFDNKKLLEKEYQEMLDEQEDDINIDNIDEYY